MEIQSFQYLRTQYGGNGDLETEDLRKRQELLSRYGFYVVVEGFFEEFGNLEVWIKQNIGEGYVESIFYGKTDYDYGFAEYFIKEEKHVEKLRQAVLEVDRLFQISQQVKSEERNKFERTKKLWRIAFVMLIVYSVVHLFVVLVYRLV